MMVLKALKRRKKTSTSASSSIIPVGETSMQIAHVDDREGHHSAIEQLPPEVLLAICAHLDPKSVLNFSRVNSTWRELLLHDQMLWKGLYHRQFQSFERWRRKTGEICESWLEGFKARSHTEKHWRRGKCHVLKVEGHQEEIYTLQFEEDLLATGSFDQTVRLWTLAPLRQSKMPVCTAVLVGHSEFVGTLRFDRTELISGSADNTMRRWDLNSLQNTATITGHASEVVALRFDNNIIISGSKDKSVKIWDKNTNECVQTLIGHSADVCGLYLDSENFRVFSGAWDHLIKIWDLRMGKELHTLQGHTDGIWTLQYDAGRDILLSGSRDTTIRVWSMKDFTSQQLRSHNGRVLCLQLRGNRLVSGAGDNCVKIWDLNSLCCEATIGKTEGRVWCLQFDPYKIITGSSESIPLKIHCFQED